MNLVITPKALVWSQGFQKGIICPVSMAKSQPTHIKSLIPVFYETPCIRVRLFSRTSWGTNVSRIKTFRILVAPPSWHAIKSSDPWPQSTNTDWSWQVKVFQLFQVRIPPRWEINLWLETISSITWASFKRFLRKTWGLQWQTPVDSR